MKILVVDDDERSIAVLETVLRAFGHKVEPANDGIEAVERLMRDEYELIISDLLMPRMDGFNLVRFVRTMPSLRHIPILIYTATYTDSKDEALVIALGADRYVTKPAEIQDLKTIVESMAPRREVQDSEPYFDPDEFKALQIERVSTKLDKRMLELQRERERLADVAECMKAAVWETDQDLIVSFATDLGRDLLGRSLREIVTAPGRALADSEAGRALVAQEAFSDEQVSWETAGGLRRQFVLSGKPYTDSHGRLLGYRGAARLLS